MHFGVKDFGVEAAEQMHYPGRFSVLKIVIQSELKLGTLASPETKVKAVQLMKKPQNRQSYPKQAYQNPNPEQKLLLPQQPAQ